MEDAVSDLLPRVKLHHPLVFGHFTPVREIRSAYYDAFGKDAPVKISSSAMRERGDDPSLSNSAKKRHLGAIAPTLSILAG
jgi:hypothetical protein